MKKEELIKKWLDHSLNPEEQRAFQELEDYEALTNINASIQKLRTRNFDVEKGFSDLKDKIPSHSANWRLWLKPAIQIAAVLVLGLSLFYYISGFDTEISTTVAEYEHVTLPDASTVELNSKSQLTFNKRNWSDTRNVYLSGEAFFKVAKGSKFKVNTSAGTIAVLGTQFNVKQRDLYFEVVCYEGIVAVTHNNQTLQLKKGDAFLVVNDKLIAAGEVITTHPRWIDGESSFNAIPLHHVLKELQYHYEITIDAADVDTLRRFTGSFTHNDLNLALQSVLIPLNIEYTVSDNTVILKGE